MKFLQSRWVLLSLRLVLAAIFVYAGFNKLRFPQQFADSIATFAILPKSLVNLMALGLPPFEIIAGLGIFARSHRRAAIFALTGLTAVFIGALVLAIIRGIPVDCGCFGGGGKASLSGPWIALGRDLAIFAGGLLLYFAELLKFAKETSKETRGDQSPSMNVMS